MTDRDRDDGERLAYITLALGAFLTWIVVFLTISSKWGFSAGVLATSALLVLLGLSPRLALRIRYIWEWLTERLGPSVQNVFSAWVSQWREVFRKEVE